MTKLRSLLLRWGPAVAWMAVIFASSATPSVDVPHFGSLDYIVKKTGHAVAYALLSLLFRRGVGLERGHAWLAWVLTLGYALLDEFHQSFVPGRHPSLVDAMAFDGGGAAGALFGMVLLTRPSLRQPVSDTAHRAGDNAP